MLDQSCCCNKEKNEIACFPCRFEEAIFQLLQGENTSFAKRPQFPGSQKHALLEFLCLVNTPINTVYYFMRKEVRGESSVSVTGVLIVTPIRWNCPVSWIPSKMWHAFFLQKTQIFDQMCCWREKWSSVSFWQVWGCNYPAYTGGNYCFYHHAQVPRFRKSSLLQFQRFVKTLLGHTVLFSEKRGQSKVFCRYWLPYMLLFWLGESVLSDDTHPI